MSKIIKENLERRFSALLEHKRSDQFASLQLDYVEYLAKTKEIEDIVEKLIDEKKVNKEILMHLFKVYNIGSITMKLDDSSKIDIEEETKKYKMPSFINLTIEDKFNVLKSYLDLTRNAERDKTRPDFLFPDSLEDRENQLFILQKFHNHLMEKLSPDKLIIVKFFFDVDKSVLIISNKNIKIRRFSDQYHLLRIIFESDSEISKDWFFSEIAELAGGGYEDKKFYNATDQIKKKIAVETGIKDFFITTRQSLKINKDYL